MQQKIIEISPQEEADRLWRGARDAFGEAEEQLARLCEAIDLGIRAVEIQVFLRLQPVRERFPGSIAMLLESPSPEVDLREDALAVPPTLTFIDMIDMLSDDDLECVSRKLHHGWEDRAHACRRARNLAREALGIVLDAERQGDLLALEAYRNRIFRAPPPVRIVASEITSAFPSLAWLYQTLSLRQAA
jgi:hypothetical protein